MFEFLKKKKEGEDLALEGGTVPEKKVENNFKKEGLKTKEIPNIVDSKLIKKAKDALNK